MRFCVWRGRCLLLVDIESSVASRVFTLFIREFPNGSYSGEPVTEAPARWPHLNIVEADNYGSGYSLLPSATVVYDVNVYSNLTSGAKQECKAIMNLVDNALMGFGSWERVFCNQTKNADTRIYRMMARYRGIPVQEKTEGESTAFRIYRK